MLSLLRYTLTIIVLALGGLRRNALRAVLTSFGILVGVTAVTLAVALGEGATRAVTDRIDALGENAYIIEPRATAQSGARDPLARSRLTEADVAAIAREAPSVRAVAPLAATGTLVAYQDANHNVQLIGSTLEYFEVRALRVARGELWSRNTERLGEKVCVIGKTAATELFGLDAEPVGKTIRVGKHPFRVIGLLAEKGQSPFGTDLDDVIVMPLDTFRSKVVPARIGQVDRILLGGVSTAEPAELRRQVSELLRQRHGLAEGAEDDFALRGQDEFRAAQEAILGALRMLLLSVAAVSLVVGGIGVMNIMLVSVAERTREIGIRMAIGAREIDIMLQFLLEAVALCLAGGTAGAILASIATLAVGRALGWDMTVSPTALAVALVTSTVIGVGFGFLPARRAASLDPIQALRRE